MSFNESDTRAKLIDPALHQRGWTENLIQREESAGAIEMSETGPRRRSKGRMDYVLRIKVTADSQPVAVGLIEAKAERMPPTQGLEQAKLYATSKRLNVPFVFASNGHSFIEFDRFTGLTSAPQPLSNFPTPVELQRRYEQGMGFSLTSDKARPLLVRYAGSEASRRYYQDAAIRAVLEKLAQGENRALLSLATGAGKTFIAVNLLKRIADAGLLRRALFVCDREELRMQALAAFQNVFGADAAAVASGQPQKNARILVATYQTLNVDSEEADANFLTTHYPWNYFSHLIIDECHRSAWGKWSQVLTRNPDAVQVGLTATPRQLVGIGEDTSEVRLDAQITADNIRWFGAPVYEYDMAQGIEDGYLAACEIVKGRVNLDDTGITAEEIIARQPVDAVTGQPVTIKETRESYQRTEYEDSILLPDRVAALCQDLFEQLLDTGGPEQKTIIFCVRDRHADDVATEMNNLYARWCATQQRERLEHYAFKCTEAAKGGKFLADLRGASRRFFLATTVDLLTTGVDVPCVRNIVFFKYVRSPIAFYQMVGRGTRLYVPDNKLMFRVYDYTNATRLFGEAFVTKHRSQPSHQTKVVMSAAPAEIIRVEGFEVHITPVGRYIVTEVNGKAMPVTLEEYKKRLAARLVAEVATLEIFRETWIIPPQRQELLIDLPDAGRSAFLVRELEEMQEFDLYDVLAEIGYGQAPQTRIKRAAVFGEKQAIWLSGMPVTAANTVRAMVNQFAKAGTEGLENSALFQTPEVVKAGGLAALKAWGQPSEILIETKRRIFSCWDG